MKKIVLSVIISLSGFVSYSQSKQQAIKELIALMQPDSMLVKSFNSKAPVIHLNPAASPEEQARFTEVMKSQIEISRNLIKRFLEEDLAPLYDRHYTLEDINAYIAFYKTPAGKKLVNTTPELQKDMANIMSAKYMPALMEELKKKSDQLRSKN